MNCNDDISDYLSTHSSYAQLLVTDISSSFISTSKATFHYFKEAGLPPIIIPNMGVSLVVIKNVFS